LLVMIVAFFLPSVELGDLYVLIERSNETGDCSGYRYL